MAFTHDPAAFQEAIQDPKWYEAINLELRALEANGTWVLTDLPPGSKAIGCKWIFKTKFHSDGTLDKYRARFVVQGYRQRAGIDFSGTFAPAAKMTTVRTLLAVVAIKGWHTCQMDVSNAFLHGDLYEEVYMHLPQGYTSSCCVISPLSHKIVSVPGSGKMCKLVKSLYGLKRAPRQWFAKLSTALVSFGFVQSKADYSLFTKQVQGKFTAILANVDDMVVIGNEPQEILKLKHQLSSQFHMKDLGDLRYFLGLEIVRTSQDLFVSQKMYVQDLI